MPAPLFLTEIAEAVRGGRIRRLKVRTLMANYGLKRRRSQGLSAIRADLKSLGLSTLPDFESTEFDDQVRFVLAGSTAATDPDDTAPPAAEPYRIEIVPGTAPVYRVLLRTYDSFERFQEKLVDGRLAHVLQSGQNPRREDRDTFPFYVVLQLADAHGNGELEAWLQEAIRLGDDGQVDDLPDDTPIVAIQSSDTTGIKEHISDLYEGLRSEFTTQVDELRAAMERKVDEIRFDAIQKLAKEINDKDAMRVIEEFDHEMRGKLADKDTEIREKQKEINLLHSQMADLNEDLHAPNGQDQYDPSDAYPTLNATVRLFQDICHGAPITVHEKALRSALRSSCTRRREVLQFLLVLRDLAQSVYERGGVGKPLKEWFSERGYEYAQSDSETAATRFGEERQILIDGVTRQMREHVTLFPRTPNCVTVYFVRNDQAQELVVGYVGPHLRTAGSHS